MAKYPKGSEWRIWDLHIHTPGTSKNDQYGNDEAAWDAFIQLAFRVSLVTVECLPLAFEDRQFLVQLRLFQQVVVA